MDDSRPDWVPRHRPESDPTSPPDAAGAGHGGAQPIGGTSPNGGGGASATRDRPALVGRVGHLVGERYELVRFIARGGMAEVWEAVDLRLDRSVAVKMLLGHLAEDAGFVERFRREAISAARLSHPNIVTVYDAGADGDDPVSGAGRPFMIMELVRGEPLRLLLRNGLTADQTIDLIGQACDGLGYAHAHGLVHRDVKPANLLVQSDGRLKVADFGIAKAIQGDDDRNAEDLTTVGSILGTAKYLSPEQVDGGPIDARSDLYSLGIVLYEAICGRPPFAGRNDLSTALQHVRDEPPRPRQVRPGVPRPLENVMLRAIAKRPADRFATAAQFKSALFNLDWRPDDARPATRRTPADRTPPSGTPTPSRDRWGSMVAGSPRDEALDTVARRRPPTLGPSLSLDAGVDQTEVGATSKMSGTAVLDRGAAPRRRGRIPGVALLLAGVLAAGAGAAGGTFAGDRWREQQAEVYARVASGSFDPAAQDGENDGLLPLIIDGRRETAWATEPYRAKRFPAGKTGVGVWVDLGERRPIGTVTVASPDQGWGAQLHVSDSRGARLDDWGPQLGFVADAGGDLRFDLAGLSGRYVLLWIFQLADTQVTISEIEVRGPA